MAKDTEKLIRQLSLISFLMAERRPVTALEIKQEVEGYSEHERRGVRAPLLRRPRRARVARHRAEGREAAPRATTRRRTTRCRPRTSTCRRSSSPTRSWARCARRCHLLDGEFAYAEPLRLALQQLSWGKPSPLAAPEQRIGRAGRDRGGRRPRAVAAAVEDRDGDLPPQDDRVRLLHDRPRRARSRARSTRTTCSSAAASST